MRNHHNHCLSHKRQVLLGDVGGADDDVDDEHVGRNEADMIIQYLSSVWKFEEKIENGNFKTGIIFE